MTDRPDWFDDPRVESLAHALVDSANTANPHEYMIRAHELLTLLDWAKANGELGHSHNVEYRSQNSAGIIPLQWHSDEHSGKLPGVDKVLLDENIITQADIDARIELTPEDVGRTVIDDHDVEWEIIANRGGHFACWSETRGMRVFAKNGYLVRDTNSARYLIRWNTGDGDG